MVEVHAMIENALGGLLDFRKRPGRECSVESDEKLETKARDQLYHGIAFCSPY
jgi:hypothetical protein